MKNNGLLPPNSTALEIKTAEVCAVDLPVNLRTVWQPEQCPAPFLPYLAWARSVDRWDENWSERTRRRVVAAAFFINRQKGTLGALRRVVEPLGFSIEITEWWQTGGVPGTFAIDIGVSARGITPEIYFELERLITDAKPVSRHISRLAIEMQASGTLFTAAATYSGEEISVYPRITPVQASGTLFTAAATYSGEEIAVYPAVPPVEASGSLFFAAAVEESEITTVFVKAAL